jgi:hypothetical protein
LPPVSNATYIKLNKSFFLDASKTYWSRKNQ